MVQFDPKSVTVVGGCGHVGLPLGVSLSAIGFSVTALDTNSRAVDEINAGNVPFFEEGLDALLQQELKSKRFRATTDKASLTASEVVVVVIGTPVDEHLNPDPTSIRNVLADLADFISDGQLIILRSTIYPGVTRMVEEFFVGLGRKVDVSFCPERIAEGYALTELRSLPQLIGARTETARLRSAEVFSHLCNRMIEVSPEEAELAKLFTNTWRYIKFAAANQLFTIANDFGVDFERVRQAIITDYPRAADMPGAGFAAGPCLFKDTMQLAAFNNNQFTLGHSSMMVNEGLPLYLVSRAERRFGLQGKRVGILGMAFKGESDDTRSSLAYKLKHVLQFRCESVLCADDNVSTDPHLIPESDLLNSADLVFIGAPHSRYKTVSTKAPVIDIWNIRGNGVLI